MEFLKVQITRIQEQLAGLSATQKMLVVSLLTIMVMTLLWWAHWAGEPEMSPLLDQSLSQDELGQITTTLETQAIPHQVVGDKASSPPIASWKSWRSWASRRPCPGTSTRASTR